MLTPQEIFDKVVIHLRTQKVKSAIYRVDLDGAFDKCMYRGPAGLKCAAGALIPDEHYTPDLENQPLFPYANDSRSAKQRALRAALKAGGVPAKAFGIVSDLQATHDSTCVEEWESDFKKLAEQHALTYTPPEVT